MTNKSEGEKRNEMKRFNFENANPVVELIPNKKAAVPLPFVPYIHILLFHPFLIIQRS